MEIVENGDEDNDQLLELYDKPDIIHDLRVEGYYSVEENSL